MRRIKASHEDYEEINEMQTLLCIWVNGHVHYNMHNDPTYANFKESIEGQLAGDEMRGELGCLLEGGPFADFVNSEEFDG